MTGTLGRTVQARHGTPGIDPDQLINRFRAVHRFLRTVEGQVPADRLVAAETLLERAGDRLALSRDHTVVALAGSTGSGKSSLFNALATLYLSPVGARRPTTATTNACVWGPPAAAAGLLDWIGVLPRQRYVRESALDGDDQSAMHGLILLDLPDLDSVDRGHRVEVDRLLGLVDLVIWVVDPQKYADRLIHESYLREFHRHREVTVVVLNQADRLAPADVGRCLSDLRQLLKEDGLGGVPALAASAHHPEALEDLRRVLEQTVAERRAALDRLSADLDTVVAGLSELVGPSMDELTGLPDFGDGLGERHPALRGLVEALAASAGVPLSAETTAQAYERRAVALSSWPLLRWMRRGRDDPSRAATTPASGSPSGGAVPPSLSALGTLAAPSVPAAGSAAQEPALHLALRAIADHLTRRMPESWSVAVNSAARSRLADIPGALGRAMAGTDAGEAGVPAGWWVAGAAQWVCAATALVGLSWLVAGLFGAPVPDGAAVPAGLLAGGLLAGALLGAVLRPLARRRARLAGQRAQRQLRTAVIEVGRSYVLAPVREVLRRYTEAREALSAAERPS